ncbi:sensor histidine kinase [Streptomyces sp. NPDC048417]|uniref:sensor histidine kinase n=1 Tax=Streptomyces sp. NPDC048417 TaxID=3155387 RepID=UPI0034248F18
MNDAPSGPFVHSALFYGDEDEYLAGTVPFVQDALAAGEPVAVAVPGENLRLLRDVLGADAGAVRLLDMRQAGRNPGRILPGVLHAFADAQPPGRRVRVVGEPVWPGRTAAEYPACVQHEALINTAFRGRGITVLCPYDIARLDPRTVADAHATHPLYRTPGSPEPRPSVGYAPEAVLARYNLPLPPAPSVAFAFDAGSLPTARHFATAEAARLGLTGVRLHDLALITAELTTNSVVHGGGSGTLWVWGEGEYVVCEVADKGHLTDPLAGRRPAAGDQRGGRGLLLVNLVADLVRVHTGTAGTTIRCLVGLGS